MKSRNFVNFKHSPELKCVCVPASFNFCFMIDLKFSLKVRYFRNSLIFTYSHFYACQLKWKLTCYNFIDYDFTDVIFLNFLIELEILVMSRHFVNLSMNIYLCPSLKSIPQMSNQYDHHCIKSVSIRSYSGLYFHAFGLNTERYSPNVAKIRTRIIPITNTFHTVHFISFTTIHEVSFKT